MLYFSTKTAAWSRLNPDCSSTCKKAFLVSFFRQTYDENDHVLSENNKEEIHLPLTFADNRLTGIHCILIANGHI